MESYRGAYAMHECLCACYMKGYTHVICAWQSLYILNFVSTITDGAALVYIPFRCLDRF